MKSARRFAIAICATILSGISATQGQSYEAIARQFCERIGRSELTAPPVPNVDGTLVHGSGPDYDIAIDTHTHDIAYWSDRRSVNHPRQGRDADAALRTEEGAWLKAEQWANAAGLDLPPRNSAKTRLNDGIVYEYVLTFTDRPFGYPPRNGDNVTMSVNRFTGKVLNMMQRRGYSYDPPNVRLTESAAIAALQRRAQQVYGAQIDAVRSLGLGYSVNGRAGEMADPGVPDLFAVRQARLAYLVEGLHWNTARSRNDVFYAHVDAETGKVLDGGLAKDSLADAGAVKHGPPFRAGTAHGHSNSSSNRASILSPSSRGFVVLCVAGLTAALAAACYFWLRQATSRAA